MYVASGHFPRPHKIASFQRVGSPMQYVGQHGNKYFNSILFKHLHRILLLALHCRPTKLRVDVQVTNKISTAPRSSLGKEAKRSQKKPKAKDRRPARGARSIQAAPPRPAGPRTPVGSGASPTHEALSPFPAIFGTSPFANRRDTLPPECCRCTADLNS